MALRPQLSMQMRLTQRPELRQVLAPIVIQSISILQLPALRLSDLIKQNLEENPALEIEQPASFEETNVEDVAVERQTSEPRTTATQEHEFRALDEFTRKDGRDLYDGPGPKKRYLDGEDKKHQALQNSPARGLSLQEYLYEQFFMLDVLEYQKVIAQAVCFNIADNGYLPYHIEAIAEQLPRDLPIPGFEHLQRLTPEFDPEALEAETVEMESMDRRQPIAAVVRGLLGREATDPGADAGADDDGPAPTAGDAVAHGSATEPPGAPAASPAAVAPVAHLRRAPRAVVDIDAVLDDARAASGLNPPSEDSGDPEDSLVALVASEAADASGVAGAPQGVPVVPAGDPDAPAGVPAALLERPTETIATPAAAGRAKEPTPGMFHGLVLTPRETSGYVDDEEDEDEDDRAGGGRYHERDAGTATDAAFDVDDDRAGGADDDRAGGTEGEPRRKKKRRKKRRGDGLRRTLAVPMEPPAPPPALSARDAYFEQLVLEGEEVLDIIRHLDPPGCGAYTLSECLLLQLHDDIPHAEFVRTLIEEHLEDVMKNRLPKITRETGRTLDEVKAALESLRLLDPRPGAQFGNDEVYYIVPDVVVIEHDERYHVEVVDRYFPKVRVNPDVARFAAEPQVSKDDRERIREFVGNARTLQECIEQREHTLTRVAESIVRVQRGFFREGVAGLKPLKMQDVAEELGLHVSTISRAVSGKYIETPRGIYPMKYFFRGGTSTTTGEDESTELVKARLKEIVDEEDKAHPLSDEGIVSALRERYGLKVARRTVTKYRKHSAIPSSRQRREY